jgi:DNA-binding HxlR family transcriptional regulator
VPKPQSLRRRALQSRDAIELLSDKWRIPALHVLTPGPLRAGQLQKAMGGISAKVLTETLRGMERDGLITRKLYAAVPPKVEYTLTQMGRSALSPLRDLCQWAEEHAEERDRARTEFDTRSRKQN